MATKIYIHNVYYTRVFHSKQNVCFVIVIVVVVGVWVTTAEMENVL